MYKASMPERGGYKVEVLPPVRWRRGKNGELILQQLVVRQDSNKTVLWEDVPIAGD